MRGYIFLYVILVFTIIGCKSSKEVNIKDDIKSEYKQSNDMEKVADKSLKEGKTTDVVINITDEYEVSQTITEYDTSLPVDSTTGTSPIKRKTNTILTKKTIDNSTKSEVYKSDLNNINTEKDNSKAELNVNNKLDVKSKQNTQKEIIIVLKWIGITSLILLVLYILYRNRKIFLRFL